MMEIVLASAAFAVSLACAAVMGLAIQRGATCTVVAVAEALSKRRFTRLASMIEASLWVLGGLLAARTLGVSHAMPPGYAISLSTVLGGVLLGVGASVNRACVFGAIARLGSGDWSYVATPVGFYAGCVAFDRLRLSPHHELARSSPLLDASSWMAIAFIAVLVVRLCFVLYSSADGAPFERNLVRRLRGRIATRVWSPHTATIVIGISFVFMLLLVGAWSYTDALAEFARGMGRNVTARGTLFAALLAGAFAGGSTAAPSGHTRITAARAARCFAGGALMACGTLLIPGGNDGLILIGMPLLWPYAWVAFLTMCVSIAAAQMIENALPVRRAAQAETS